MDYEVQKTARTCSVSGREIAPGETFYSVLVRDGAAVKRVDFAADAWTEPPPDAIGWWKSTMVGRDAKKAKLAPSEVLLELFRELQESVERRELRYVLTLLLIRRRLLRLEETVEEDDGGETLVLYCARDEQTYRVPVVVPDKTRADEIQTYLAQLLYQPVA